MSDEAPESGNLPLPFDVVLADRAVALRRSGRTYREIAEKLKIDQARAEAVISELLAQIEAPELSRRLELARLDRIFALLWTRMLEESEDLEATFSELSDSLAEHGSNGNGKSRPKRVRRAVNLAVVDRMLNIIRMRAQLRDLLSPQRLPDDPGAFLAALIGENRDRLPPGTSIEASRVQVKVP